MRWIALLPALVALSVAACGEESEEDQCREDLAAFEPCGGDLTGTWTVETFCTEQDGLDFAPDDPACRDMEVDISDSTVTGTVTFGADGSYTSSTSTHLDAQMTLSDACLQAMGGSSGMPPGSICEAANVSREEMTLSCSYDDGCLCEITADFTGTDQGTYEVRDSTFVRTDRPGDEGSSFCVDGDRLLVKDSADTGGGETSVLQIFRRK